MRIDVQPKINDARGTESYRCYKELWKYWHLGFRSLFIIGLCASLYSTGLIAGIVNTIIVIGEAQETVSTEISPSLRLNPEPVGNEQQSDSNSISLSYHRVATASRQSTTLPWRATKQVTFNVSQSIKPTFDIDHNNNLHVVWQDDRGGKWAICYVKLDTNGNKLINDFILPLGEFNCTNPQIALDSQGDIYILWQADYTWDKHWEIKLTKLRYTPESDEPKILFTTRVSNWHDPENREHSINPKIAVDCLDNIHIVWQEAYENTDYWNYALYYWQFDTNGEPSQTSSIVPGRWEPFKLTQSLSHSVNPVFAPDSGGNVHIVWLEAEDRDNYYLYYKKLNRYGDVLVDDRQISVLHTDNVTSDIVIDAEQNSHIVFDDNRYHSVYRDIIYTKLDPLGNDIVDDKTLTSTTDLADSRSPAIGIDARDELYIAWCDSSAFTTPINHQIYYVKLNNDGAEEVPPSQLTTTSSIAQVPKVKVDRNNNTHIIWQDDADGYENIYHVRTDKINIELSALICSDLYPIMDSSIFINASVYNTGPTDATVVVNFYDLLAGEDVPVVLSSRSTIIRAHESATFSIYTLMDIPGEHRITVEIDPDDIWDETREDDNSVIRNIFTRYYELNLTVTPTSVELEPEDSVNILLEVTNLGNYYDTIALELTELSPGWDTLLSYDTITLDVGAVGTVELAVRAPAVAQAAVGTYTLTAFATSTSLPSATDSAQITILLKQIYDISLATEFFTFSVEPGDYLQVAIDVINNGNGMDNVELTVSGPYATWAVFEEPVLMLQVGEERTTILNISIPPDTPPGANYSILAIGKSAGSKYAVKSTLNFTLNVTVTPEPVKPPEAPPLWVKLSEMLGRYVPYIVITAIVLIIVGIWYLSITRRR
jgi:hypothetical protein